MPSAFSYEQNASPTRQGKSLAEQFRQFYELGDDPIDRIESFTEHVNADLLIRPLPTDVEAISVKDPQTGNIVIGVGTSASPYRQRFTVAHEVGHILADDIDRSSEVPQCEPNSPSETRANSFARNVLCPLDGVKKIAQNLSPAAPETLSKIIQHFRVSPSVAAIQLKEAGLISEEVCDELSKEWSAPKLASLYGWREQYNADALVSDQPRPSPRLVADATKGYRKGVVSSSAVALARGISSEQVKQELATAPAEPQPTDSPFTELDAFFEEG